MNVINIQKYRIYLSRLRLSSHRLHIETGRWTNTPLNERHCDLCNCLEDEYHFVLECNRYNELRKKYISEYYWRRPSMFKLTELLNNENEQVIKNLGLYVEKSFIFRNSELYLRH